MIIFGHRHRKISPASVTVQLPDSQGTLQPVAVDVFLHVIHIFWIPICPVGKKVGFREDDSIYTIRQEALTPEDKAAVKQMTATAGTPWWSFSGLILLVLFVAFGLISDALNKGEEAEPTATATEAPAAAGARNAAVGDVWVLGIAKAKDNFTYAKVVSTQADSVTIELCAKTYTLKNWRKVTHANFAEVLRNQAPEFGPRTVQLSLAQVAMRKKEGMLVHELPAE